MNKCFLAKSPVGSLPFVHREISHCGEISVRARVLPRETQRRATLLAGFYFRSKANANSLGSSRGGEQVLSWQSHGVALPTCELVNAPLFGAFTDRAQTLPREKLSSAVRLRESPYYKKCDMRQKRFSPPRVAQRKSVVLLVEVI